MTAMPQWKPRVATSHSKGKKTKGSQPRKSEQVPCPRCKLLVKRKNLASHMEKKCSKRRQPLLPSAVVATTHSVPPRRQPAVAVQSGSWRDNY